VVLSPDAAITPTHAPENLAAVDDNPTGDAPKSPQTADSGNATRDTPGTLAIETTGAGNPPSEADSGNATSDAPESLLVAIVDARPSDAPESLPVVIEDTRTPPNDAPETLPVVIADTGNPASDAPKTLPITGLGNAPVVGALVVVDARNPADVPKDHMITFKATDTLASVSVDSGHLSANPVAEDSGTGSARDAPSTSLNHAMTNNVSAKTSESVAP